MGEFTKTIEASKVRPGSMMSADAGGDEVLIANVGGDYYAIGAICRHEQWDLSEGNLQGSRVVCAGHGAVWDL